MKKFLKKIIWISLISFYFFQIEKVQAIVPYYYFPTIKNLQKAKFIYWQKCISTTLFWTI